MQIKDLMSREIEMVSSDTTVKEAAKFMKEFNIGIMPVRDGRRVTGMITDRDITIRAVAESRNPDTTKVKDIMTPEFFYCYDDDEIEEASKLMESKHVHRVLVFNHEERPVGIISLGDIAVRGDEKMAGRILSGVSFPYQHKH